MYFYKKMNVTNFNMGSTNTHRFETSVSNTVLSRSFADCVVEKELR
jgi:hypothetical protein